MIVLRLNMILYYGSKTLFEKPTFGVGNITNDYGLGFYLTPSFDSTKMWAGQFEQDGYVLKFDVDFKNLNILYLNRNTEEDVLKWITILVKHRFSLEHREEYKDVIAWLIRHFDINIEGVDMIIGYRADDAYFRYAIDFVDGKLSIEKLLEAMELGNLGLQYALMSRKAYSLPKFLGSTKISKSNEYQEFRKRTAKEYNRLKETEDRYKNTFIGELMKKYGK